MSGYPHTESEIVARGGRARLSHGRARPGVSIQHVLEGNRFARVRVEPVAPGQAGIAAAPAGSKPPRPTTPVKDVLVDACVVGGLQPRPEIVGRGPRDSGNDHLARQRGEPLARRRPEPEEVP